MIIISNMSKKISLAGFCFAILGYVISFHQVYAFHLIVLFFLFYMLFKHRKIKRVDFNITKPILYFLIFSILSLIWTLNLDLGLRNIFYLVCGFFTVFFTVFYCNSISDLERIIKIFIVLSFLNFMIGFLESLGIMRLPMSPYSPYASFFGYTQSDLNEVDSFALSSVLERPTGFNGNPNNFGFVFAISLPFLFYFNNFTKYISLFFLIWFNLYLQSRGLFLATLVFFIGIFFIDIKKNIKFIPVFFLFFFFSLFFINIDFSEYRFSQTFESIEQGIDLILSGNIEAPKSSTDIRSYIYSLGFYHLFQNPLLGLGVGGIQSVLSNLNFEIQSFHFYFLEVLINYGAVFYIFFIAYYIKTIIRLNKIRKNVDNIFYLKISKSCMISLLIMPFASISPSSIVYVLCAWVVFGISLAIIKLDQI